MKKKAEKKVVIIGDIAIGKTSLIRRYIEDVFTEETPTTIGSSFFIKQWNGKNIALWDTAGAEQFNGLRNFYCRGAHAMILCYNICERNSYQSLLDKHSMQFDCVAQNCVLVFVGMKSDLINNEYNGIVLKRAVNTEEVMETYLKYKSQLNCLGHPQGKIPIFETSAKLGSNVTNVFEYIFQTLVPSSKQIMYTLDSSLVELSEHSNNQDDKSKCYTC